MVYSNLKIGSPSASGFDDNFEGHIMRWVSYREVLIPASISPLWFGICNGEISINQSTVTKALFDIPMMKKESSEILKKIQIFLT